MSNKTATTTNNNKAATAAAVAKPAAAASSVTERSKIARTLARLRIGFGPHSTYDLPLKAPSNKQLGGGNDDGGNNKKRQKLSAQGWYTTVMLTDAAGVESKFPVVFLDVGRHGASFEAKDFNTVVLKTAHSPALQEWSSFIDGILTEYDGSSTGQIPPQYRGLVSAMRSMDLSSVHVYHSDAATAEMSVKVTSVTHLVANQHPQFDASGEKVPYRQFIQTPGDLPCYAVLPSITSSATEAALSEIDFTLVPALGDVPEFVQSPESNHTILEGSSVLAILRPKSVRCSTSAGGSGEAELAWMQVGWVVAPESVAYLRRSGVRAAYMLDATPSPTTSKIFGLTAHPTEVMATAELGKTELIPLSLARDDA